MEQLRRLEEHQNDNGFLEHWGNTKLSVRRKLATYIHRNTGVLVDSSSLFDVQVADGLAPRTVIFGGKAAPGNYMAKLIIRFINGIKEVAARGPRTWPFTRKPQLPQIPSRQP